MYLHLSVIQDNVGAGEEPTQASRLFSPRTHDFAWNNTFTAFRPIKLRWWDDASYIAYQGDDGGEEEIETDTFMLPPPMHDTIPCPPPDCDEIPF